MYKIWPPRWDTISPKHCNNSNLFSGKNFDDNFVSEGMVSWRASGHLSAPPCAPQPPLQVLQAPCRTLLLSLCASSSARRVVQFNVECSNVQWTAKGASGKGPCQKTSKLSRSVKTISTFLDHFVQGKRYQTSPKSVKNASRHFPAISTRHLFSGPCRL